jgi:phosphate transport system permease protein
LAARLVILALVVLLCGLCGWLPFVMGMARRRRLVAWAALAAVVACGAAFGLGAAVALTVLLAVIVSALGPADAAPVGNGGEPPARVPLPSPSPWARHEEQLIERMLLLAALFSIAITAGIVVILVANTTQFFRDVAEVKHGGVGAALAEFFTSTAWAPLHDDADFGILPLVCGTVVTTGVALMVALPVGSVVAIYLSEYAPFLLREVLKPLLELLSAVPTVVYGYFALQFVTPLLRGLLRLAGVELPVYNMLSAGIVMGVMIIPYVSSLSEDAMHAVPSLLREGAYALGANKLTTATRVVYPAALSGIGSAYILGISRAIGETMIVAVAAGQQPLATLNPAKTGETITAFIVRVSQGDLGHGTVGYRSIFAAGAVLFVMTMAFNVLGWALRKRFREAY